MPRVSIGLPVYNGERYLKESLDSILSQTYEHFELIISDNASTDHTQEVCQEYANKDQRIKYFRNQKNLGAAKNYNRVFKLSTGKYFKWAAHDDVIAPIYLERCVEIFDQESDIVLSFPRIAYIDERGKIFQSQQCDFNLHANSTVARVHRLVNYQINSDDIYWAIFGLIRSDALRKTQLIGRYVASDQVLLMQLQLLGKFYQVPELLYFRRDHSLTSTREHQTPKSRLSWFDPNIQKKIVLPNWTLFFKHLASVRRTKLEIFEKISCYYEVFRRFAYKWRTLGGELKFVPEQMAEKT